MSNIIRTFNFIRFAEFLKHNNVASTAIAAVLSERISDIMNVFMDNIIMPIINVDCVGSDNALAIVSISFCSFVDAAVVACRVVLEAFVNSHGFAQPPAPSSMCFAALSLPPL